ncbi:putative secreted protein [Wickerhamomyces ciferrii]|uniref:Secreted protein n=1 Tax=Wickerhamomyces ciferrii (strain ATCC 14091 / BCRC 22168 / CBS 111 / JCM 3599 / NBRC 0793 / NRRL Y-1031 F-60-10) TaxID=1206466 RepID=K0KTC4_WICCF|nr:uncharacterized protein BN7_6010 [Wickerhamomyces ciferrii]CCH46416.1 putative secreted protein [Wickerhamomyces ciferrii]
MQLFKLISTATLVQSILCANLNPIGFATPGELVDTVNFYIRFNPKDLTNEGTFSIKAEINDDNVKNNDFDIIPKAETRITLAPANTYTKSTNYSSTNLTPKKEIKYERKSSDAILSYKFNDEDHVTYQVSGYSSPRKNINGTSIDFIGFFQPKVDNSAVIELPFKVSAIFE